LHTVLWKKYIKMWCSIFCCVIYVLPHLCYSLLYTPQCCYSHYPALPSDIRITLFVLPCVLCVTLFVLPSVIHIMLHCHLIYASQYCVANRFTHHNVCVAICYTHYAVLLYALCTTVLFVTICYTHTIFLCFHLLLLHVMLRYHAICASHSFASLSFVWIIIVLPVVTVWYTHHTRLCFRLLYASQCFELLSVICCTLLVLLSVMHLTLCSVEDSHQCRSETCSGRSRWFPDRTSRTCRCQGKLYIHYNIMLYLYMWYILEEINVGISRYIILNFCYK